jgi:hypothetical protein
MQIISLFSSASGLDLGYHLAQKIMEDMQSLGLSDDNHKTIEVAS